MKSWHNTIKYAAIALAILLIIGIFSAIFHALSFIFFAFDPNITGEYTTHEFENDISVLDIDIKGINFEVEATDNPHIVVESNYESLTVQTKGDVLLIKDKKTFYFNTGGKAVLKLYIPKDKIFDKVDINTGTGRTDMENLQAKTIDMQFGAGKTMLQNISVSDNAFIEGGVGKLYIRDSKFCNLNLEMGVGKLEFSGTLLGRSILKMGVGASEISLIGSLDDYKLHVEKGIGNIYIDGESVKSDTQWGQGSTEIFLEGGVSSVSIDFSE